MKKIILPIIMFIFISSFSQNTEKVELTKQEIKYLAENITSPIFEPKTEDYENSLKNNLINYGFDILYNNEVIYRGVIKKPSLSGINYNMSRKNTAFCFEYNMFDSDTKLELAENKKIKIGKTKNGKKYFWTDNYELFNIDRYKGILKVNDSISEKIKIKFYKF